MTPEERLTALNVHRLPPVTRPIDETSAETTAKRDALPNGSDADENKPLPKLVPVRFVEGEVIQPLEWIVHDGWIPKRKVTLVQADGGEGKTQLMQQLQSSCAIGLAWLGLRVTECVSIGFYTEDEEHDIKERQAAIDVAYSQRCVGTGKMHLFARADEENELVVFDRARKPSLTKFYRQVCETALDYRARLVGLDVAVDLFGGDEIKRSEVRAFIRSLNSLARKINGAVVLTAHVSMSGIRTDGGHSGSTRLVKRRAHAPLSESAERRKRFNGHQRAPPYAQEGELRQRRRHNQIALEKWPYSSRRACDAELFPQPAGRRFSGAAQ